ncbi:hypothetical protein M976_01935 [Buttiauxella ferragutiae ATCC 51602]|jgi:anti-sigma28 factor (negative regulator of flagellin synthesis)|uniref:Anti-sigma-28 factor FlgM C-terminal domain-containing protein n=1 Tax=Buttiauxella ferragutiae ATCC 51602 TaxID=1354252 RepID=A0ABX2W965_9ENTR|nr:MULTISPECIES: flagellar biosynthesis anti-sigma factor FlgM [Buttiauxella]OAT28096.1 hypothetical protein M976_01935 [Buttiauxella ferragutiae ATCC 51602]TDN49800.1 anti-sigma-28 factor FlgM [Buttiauxella sp. JUb87]
MNITSLGSLAESSLQSTYAKQTQTVASEIAASENNKPLQVNAPAEAPIDQKTNSKDANKEPYTLPPSEFPAEVPINVPVSAALTQALASEVNQFPDIDHSKVANVMEMIRDGKMAIDSDDLAGAMMDFYQGR